MAAPVLVPRTSLLETYQFPFRPAPSVPEPAPTRSQSVVDALAFTAVLAGAVLLGLFAYHQYLEVARQRWACAIHDRNAHYLLALNLAQDFRQGNGKQLLFDLDSAKTWPPLHGILAAVALAAGGMDYRLAVLPSWGAWVGTIVLSFLLARRMAPRGGNLAGLVAVAFLVGSPAHRVYATDVMLESLGAFLSLLVLYCYLVARQHPSHWANRGLALALTALFFHKYNYWFLALVALTTVEIASHRAACWDFMRAAAAGIDWRRWLHAQARRPGNYLLAAVLAILAALAFHGPIVIPLINQLVIHSPYNLIHVADIILFVRMARWWFRERAVWKARLDNGFRQMLAWHGLPIAVWFLLPRRLGYFLWYLLANNGETPRSNPLEGVSFYAGRWVEDYHLGLWSALIGVSLIGAAIASWRRLRPAGAAVLVFLLLAAVVTFPHPNRKSRFLHSWIAAGWVAAGVGLVNLVHGRVMARRPWARPWLATSAVAAIGLTQLPGLVLAGHSPERGHNDDYVAASTRDLSDFYLPHLADSRRALLLASIEIKQMLRWSFLERYPSRDRLEVEIKGLGVSAAEDQRCFANWLAATPCDVIVFVDVPNPSFFYGPTGQADDVADRLRGLLAAQADFQPVQRRTFLHYSCTVTVFRRNQN
jgi:hypothetical protein